jgi:uncharacterized delta-60 repeat protein
MKRNFTQYLKLTALLLFINSISPAFAQDGTYDNNFGAGGKVSNPDIGPTWSPVRLLVQKDGSILYVYTGGDYFNRVPVILRYLPNGQIDPTSRNLAALISDFGIIQDVTLAPDDKIVMVVGQKLIRFMPDGSADPSFSGDGIVDMPYFGASVGVSYEGKIMVAGSSHVVRYNTDGTLDASLDGDGIMSHSIGQFIGPHLAILPNSIFQLTSFRNNEETLVNRYNWNGSPDATFSGDGKASINGLRSAHNVHSVALQEDGKTVIATIEYVTPSGQVVVVYRIDNDGNLDRNFGTHGVTRFSIGGYERVKDIAIQQDGKIVVSGDSPCSSTNCGSAYQGEHLYIARLLPSGSLDPSWDGDGKMVIGATSTSHEAEGAIAASGNKIIIAGITRTEQYSNPAKAFLAQLNNSSSFLLDHPQAFYLDMDRDNYGTDGAWSISYKRLNGYAFLNGDCNDSDASVHPGVPESMDGRDNDCDGSVDEGAPSGPYTMIPAKIEAENWSSMFQVGTENTTDEGGGINVGYIDPGNWVEYNITAPVEGSYQLHLRLASPHANSKIDIRSANGTLLATVQVPVTGDWQKWQTVIVPINLRAGNETVRLISTGTGYWNINWLQFVRPGVGYTRIPAKIEAEHYNASKGVVIEMTRDAGGGMNVGYIDWGDYMDYNITVPAAGWYKINFRTATPSTSDPRFEVMLGSQVLANVSVPKTDHFQDWKTHSVMVQLPAGNQTIRIISRGGYWNFNWLQFETHDAAMTQNKSKSGITESLELQVSSGIVNIAPNPVRDAFTLELDNRHAGAVRAEVVSIAGRVEKGFTFSKTTGKSKHILSLSGLASGEYLLRITINGTVQTKKLIKL